MRLNSGVGNEIFRGKPLLLGTYSEAELYGAAGSPLFRFKAAVRALANRAEKITLLSAEEVEYGYQVTLFWAEVGKLKEFLGVSAPVSGVVAELRTAQYQFLRRDTPREALVAVGEALRLVAEARRLDFALVDQMMERLERGGVDPLAPDALRVAHG